MPTPFSHLYIAERLLRDEAVPQAVRQQLKTECPAYVLGSVIADARPAPDMGRDATHFYRYDRPMTDHPWRVMFSQYPSLLPPRSTSHWAYLAGYVVHLAADEYWSLHMLAPHFAAGDWGESLRWRFFVLHLLLIYMDERDEARLAKWHPETLLRCQPDGWLPFIPDDITAEWRDFIAEQIIGESKTLEIFGERIHVDPARLRAMLDSPETMQSMLWDHITPELLAEIEAELYDFSRDQLLIFAAEATASST